MMSISKQGTVNRLRIPTPFLPLTVWFQGIYFMAQDKTGCSAMKLHRQLGISYNAAWRMRHKLMQVMMERDRAHPLDGIVELDDAYLGASETEASAGEGRRARPLSSPPSRPMSRGTRCA